MLLSNLSGLSNKDVETKQKKFGLNELPKDKKNKLLTVILEVVKEPMFLLLLFCGLIYLFLGSLEDAGLLLLFVFVILGLTIYQQNKTEKALSALKDLSSPRALVIRNGEQIRIPGKDVVKEDLIIIKEGDRVPADCILLAGKNIKVDESLLTGESEPVDKTPPLNVEIKEPIQIETLSIENSNKLYSSSMVLTGQGLAIVSAIGEATKIGQIGKTLEAIKIEPTHLQKEITRIVKSVFIIAIFIAFLVFAIYSFKTQNLLQGILTSLTLVMAILPEEFPVILTIFLALGAWRISKKNVLTRKMSAVETLGSATVLAVDKTGTLTENKMAIAQLFNGKTIFNAKENLKKDLPENFHQIIEYGILASRVDPFDPMEKALLELGKKFLADTEHIHTDWAQIREYAITTELLALSYIWETDNQHFDIVAAKGAPEAIFDLCHLKEDKIKEYSKIVDNFAQAGLRVIGVAKTLVNKDTEKKQPENQHEFDFEFIGLIGLADPVRSSVPAAIKECYTAGIRVIMITGDYPKTAIKIADEIKLDNPELVITGDELAKLTPDELNKKIKNTNIFARIMPEQKLLIVETLKKLGEVVAMTGDGVNDAPSIKAANIGVAMGERGTDVARECSDLVLLKDDFTSIKEAVKMGRRIFDNIKKALTYTIAVHVPIAGMALIPIILDWPLLFYPVHIVFLELIIDPACSLVFESEPEEHNIMTRPPRDPNQPLFKKSLLLISIIQGFSSLIITAMAFKIALVLGQSADEARAFAFITLIISNLCLIITNRAWDKNIFQLILKPNKTLAVLIVTAFSFLLLVTYLPFLQKIFHFAEVHVLDLIVASSLGVISIIWFEIFKLFIQKNPQNL